MTADLLATLPPDRRAAALRLLTHAAAADRQNGPSPVPTRRTTPVSDPVPLSFIQERLWYHEQLIGRPDMFVYPLGVRLRGAAPVDTLRAALRAMVARHEALRTMYATADGFPVQYVTPVDKIGPHAEDIDFTVVDMPGDSVDKCRARAANDAAVGFDRTRQWPIRACLYRCAPDDALFVVNLHYAVIDVPATDIFWRDFAALYRSIVDGTPARLPELSLHQPDFAVWQRSHLRGERLAKLVRFWKDATAGVDLDLALPLDRPRGSRRERPGAFYPSSAPAGLAELVAERSRQLRVTPAALMLAIYRLLIARHTGQVDILIGIDVSERSAESDSLMGAFVNVIAMRCRIDEHATVRDMIQREHAAALAGYAHHSLPYNVLIRELNPVRRPGRPPLLQTGFTCTSIDADTADAGPTTPNLPGLAVDPCLLPLSMAQHDLGLNAVLTPTSITAQWVYIDEWFDESTVAGFAARFWTLVANALADPEQPVATVGILPDSERDVLLANAVSADSQVRSRNLSAEVARVAAADPDRSAVRDATHARTYRELDETANCIAHALIGLGVGREDRVGVLLDRSVDVPTVMLAIHRAGAAFVPLDRAHPADRIHYLLTDSGATTVVTADGSPVELPAGIRVLDLTHDAPTIAGQPATRPQVSPVDDALAYILYTSGSTGRPKGVEISHRNLAHMFGDAGVRMHLASGRRTVATTAINFDVFVLDMLAPLAHGATVYVADSTTTADPRLLARLYEAERPDYVQATPTQWRLLLETADDGWAGIRGARVLCGGEELHPDLAAKLLTAIGPDGVLWNAYGPTESTVYSCMHAVDGTERHRVPMGRPTREVTQYVLDSHMGLAPRGVVGELYIGGVGIGRGYHTRPGLTAERFVPDPFHPGGRLYRSGDLARMLPDGAVEYIGRNDNQVKIRGIRVEIEEIERVVGGLDDVLGCAVRARTHRGGDTALVAYVVAATDPPDLQRMRTRLRALLPAPLVPRVIAIDDLPIGPTGKVDRAALAGYDTSGTHERGPQAPRTDAERLVAELWRETLAVDVFAVEDNFFELGGYSTAAARLATLMSERLGKVITVTDLTAHQTLESQALILVDGAR